MNTMKYIPSLFLILCACGSRDIALQDTSGVSLGFRAYATELGTPDYKSIEVPSGPNPCEQPESFACPGPAGSTIYESHLTCAMVHWLDGSQSDQPRTLSQACVCSGGCQCALDYGDLMCDRPVDGGRALLGHAVGCDEGPPVSVTCE